MKVNKKKCERNTDKNGRVRCRKTVEILENKKLSKNGKHSWWEIVKNTCKERKVE